MFYKMFKHLISYFHVFAIDLIGMGASSREDFKYDNIHEIIKLFVESIEEWRKVLNLTNFILVGHSMGGYISCNYAMMYAQHVKKLILISPAAISKRPEDHDIDMKRKNMTTLRRMVNYVEGVVSRRKISPFALLRNFKFMSGFLLKFFLKRKFKFNLEENQLFAAYFVEILKLPESTENSVHYIFEPGAIAKYPIEDVLSRDLKVPVDIYFGDRDWMDWQGCYRFATKCEVPCKITLIQDASHHINIDNPEELCEYIIAENI